MMLTSHDRRSKNVRVVTVIISELELGDIQRHIFAAHFVECADDAALEDRPEAFDGLRVDCADDILTARMVNSRVRVIPIERIVGRILIRTKQAHSMGDGFADERGKSIGTHVRDNARDHVSLSADGANDRRFAGPDAAGSTVAAAFIPMLVFRQAADECFIDFDNAAELLDILHQCGSDFVAHEPSGFIGTEAHVTTNLKSAHAFLASQHQVDNTIPVAKRLVGIFKNSIDQDREAITGRATRRAFRALPMPLARWQVIYSRIAATRAANALRPAARLQVRLAGVFARKHCLKLRGGKLMNRLWLFAARHGVLLTMEGGCHA
jgi:hypothetical protein